MVCWVTDAIAGTGQTVRVPSTLNDSIAFPQHSGMLSSIEDAQDWNTMMSNLLR